MKSLAYMEVLNTNDQDKEFVNQVAESLPIITRTEQKTTSAYHPQSNGLCERQNGTIEDSLIKVLEDKTEHWPEVIDGVLLAQRVSVYISTKYSPFIYCAIDIPFYQSIYGVTLQMMEKIRILMTTIPFNLFFIQRYQLEKLPTISVTPKLPK